MTDIRNERVNLTKRTGIAIKVVIRSYFRPEVYKLYQFPLPSIFKSKNLYREVGEWGGGGVAPRDRVTPTCENTYHSKYEALTQCCSTIARHLRRRHDIKTTLGQCLS